MSSNDYVRKFDTVMAAAFRKAGFTSVLPDDPKAGSHRQPLQIHVLGVQWQSAINLGSGYSACLDLHGRSEDRAYEELETFLKGCIRKGYCTVLVITGKGTGKLRRLVRLWLKDGPLKQYVANARDAASWDGGEGALYAHLSER